MRLYLNAESKNKVGYVPDWLKVSYENFELTLDIRGYIDYDSDNLNCRCKGKLIPWVLYNLENGNEINLYDLSVKEVDEMFPINRIVEILQTGTNFRIGVYPVDNSNENMKLSEKDILINCTGQLEIYDGVKEHRIDFEFEAEYNG